MKSPAPYNNGHQPTEPTLELGTVARLIDQIERMLAAVHNPGLATGILLFLPLGGYGVNLIGQAGGGTVWAHLLGAGSAIVIHVAILIHVRNKGKRLARFEAGTVGFGSPSGALA